MFQIKYVQMAKKHMKRSSMSPVIRETQLKITRGYYFSPIRMAVQKKKKRRKEIAAVGEEDTGNWNPRTLLLGT